jgi:hypothetical protein
MQKIGVVSVAAISLLLLGCPVRSLQPLFSESDLAYNPALIGKWADGEDIYTFGKLKGNEYAILLSEQKPADSVAHSGTEGDTITFIGRLGRLGGNWFLDTYPAREEGDFHLLPTHIIAKLRIDGDTLFLASLEGDWLKKTIEANRLKVKYAIVDGDLILTGSTREVQETVKKFADDEGAFPNSDKLVRMK